MKITKTQSFLNYFLINDEQNHEHNNDKQRSRSKKCRINKKIINNNINDDETKLVIEKIFDVDDNKDIDDDDNSKSKKMTRNYSKIIN